MFPNLTCAVDEGASVEELMAAVAEETGLAPEKQKIRFAGRILYGESVTSFYSGHLTPTPDFTEGQSLAGRLYPGVQMELEVRAAARSYHWHKRLARATPPYLPRSGCSDDVERRRRGSRGQGILL